MINFFVILLYNSVYINITKGFKMSTDMTVKQAAKYAGIHYTELIILVRNNVIPSRKFGFQYQVSKSDIDKWINKKNNKKLSMN